MSNSRINHLLIHFQTWIPARAVGKYVHRLSRCKVRWIKNLLIRGFAWFYCVNKSEAAAEVPKGYASFNAFFTRELKAGVRPIDSRPDSLLSPADGVIAQSGYASAGKLLQAKGLEYSAADLLGDPGLATKLANSAFATIYLAPHNYHRVHMPMGGVLERTTFIPGLLYSVNARTTAAVENLYALNERLVCQFRNNDGPFALVLVGAMNVASISTAWAGEITPPPDRSVMRTDFSANESLRFERGDYMGHFNLGSTVVFIAPGEDIEWLQAADGGERVQAGQRIGSHTNQAQP